MTYRNPIISGFYPDPSVCRANGKYYLVASSFQYFPGVPLFESDDLINWTQIGFCLTRKSQLPLDKASCTGGIYAPTIRYNDGRFYMVTTNQRNFYVYTDDIYGEWSEPIFVDQGGIDPSLYFEDGKTYFMSNGTDDDGKNAVLQCEINIKTGKKLTESKVIWHGAGGRYLESPHLYKIDGQYYIMAAEGGTEYGHMVIYGKGDSIYGPFTNYKKNPVLTNRDLGGYAIQGCGHADLIEDNNGNWWLYHLAFRQLDKYVMHHHLGREVYVMPVSFDKEGWFTVGEKGNTTEFFETDAIKVKQEFKKEFTFENTAFKSEWQHLRSFNPDNYIYGKDSIKIKATPVSIDSLDDPSFICIHQKEFNMELSVDVTLIDGEAGISIYMDENHHYDLYLEKNNSETCAVLKLNIGDIKHIQNKIKLNSSKITLKVASNAFVYNFYAGDEHIGYAQTKYLSSEVNNGFTGVVLGLYSQNGKEQEFNEFKKFICKYEF